MTGNAPVINRLKFRKKKIEKQGEYTWKIVKNCQIAGCHGIS